jgi:hypothetical protein
MVHGGTLSLIDRSRNLFRQHIEILKLSSGVRAVTSGLTEPGNTTQAYNQKTHNANGVRRRFEGMEMVRGGTLSSNRPVTKAI